MSFHARSDATDLAPRVRRWRLAGLSVGQVISWGILYYALIVAAPVIAADTGWSLATVMLAFSVGLITSAIAGVLVGRWLDEGSPRLVMATGSGVGALGLVIVSTAGDVPTFTIGWIVTGAGQSAVLYQAAFTVITRRHEADRRRAMTVVTLAGGLASTMFAPLVAGMLSVLDWRATMLALALALVVTTTPLHWWSLERMWPPRPARVAEEPHHTVSTVLRTRRFWALELSMIAVAASLYSVTLAIIPLYTERGMSFQLAAWGLGLLGAGQVLGRLVFVVLPHAASPWRPLAATAALAALTLGLLALVPGPPWLLIAIGVAAGAVRGAQTLVQGAAVVDRWGARSYGAINGAFAAPVTAVTAIGPALGPVLALGTGSYAAMGLVAAALAVVGLALARFT
ncbi:MFS transporter [Agrococcus baldri]|uniref:MFS transporter n=1 Tax=Agrococcus baldri TaxID=153730 RepID=A0AA87RGT9_9MICO|nr:MFS transporter [Agrococcus baldri]GEK79343.1 MFS transporter [Agrococcus baldri]